MLSRIFVVYIYLFTCYYVKSIVIQVEVEQGWLEGQTLVPSTRRGEYYGFKGIPYAAPPVGELRFRAPQPPLKWKQTRNATKHGSVCVQFETDSRDSVIGSEDCLFLNVYTPNLKPTSPLAVIVFIHGGGFYTGSGDSEYYGPDYLMDYSVILVTINYRLGVFGFLSADTEDAPGNAGLKDQIAALQWVQRNIKNFGGDPKQVTIFGQGAGASAVTMHVVAPSAKGLFQKAIASGASILNNWAITFEPRRRAFVLGSKLGFDTDDPYKLVKFLQSVPAKILFQVRPDVLISDEILDKLFLTSYFSPVVEKKFEYADDQYITEHPTAYMCRNHVNPVDFMTGHTSSEGLSTAVITENNIFNFYPKYKELLVPAKISFFRSPKKVLELADRVNDFYFKNKTITPQTMEEFVKFYSHFVYVFDIHAFIEKLPQYPSTTRYFYSFGIYSSRNVNSRTGAMKYGIKKATHKDELAYLFHSKSFNTTENVYSPEFHHIGTMCTLITNFVRYGNPTPDRFMGFTWPEYNPNRQAAIIDANGRLSSKTIHYDRGSDLGFWRELYASVDIDL